jgi:hypothetical protein
MSIVRSQSQPTPLSDSYCTFVPPKNYKTLREFFHCIGKGMFQGQWTGYEYLCGEKEVGRVHQSVENKTLFEVLCPIEQLQFYIRSDVQNSCSVSHFKKDVTFLRQWYRKELLSDASVLNDWYKKVRLKTEYLFKPEDLLMENLEESIVFIIEFLLRYWYVHAIIHNAILSGEVHSFSMGISDGILSQISESDINRNNQANLHINISASTCSYTTITDAHEEKTCFGYLVFQQEEISSLVSTSMVAFQEMERVPHNQEKENYVQEKIVDSVAAEQDEKNDKENAVTNAHENKPRDLETLAQEEEDEVPLKGRALTFKVINDAYQRIKGSINQNANNCHTVAHDIYQHLQKNPPAQNIKIPSTETIKKYLEKTNEGWTVKMRPPKS